MSTADALWEIEAGEQGGEPIPARTRLTGTLQQEAFWSELESGNQHVVLEARAGTGKSTSCREGMHRLLEAYGDLSIRYCCFNKAIADEFRARCPTGVEVGTMHSFGLRALSKVSPDLRIEKDRVYLILDTLGIKEPRWLRKAIATLVSLAKNHAIDPDGDPAATYDALDELLLHYDVETWGRTGQVIGAAFDVLDYCKEDPGVIDFDDMLWLPAIHGMEFPKLDFLFLDEAQDLNPVQHRLAELMSGGGRTIVVGDPCQAIYGFRGADTNSIPNLRTRLCARNMPLTVTFRCPRSHVELAREIVPDFEAAPEAPDGELRYGHPEDLASVQPGDLVLCRANAPLIAACLDRIRSRQRAVMRGRAFGDQLSAILRRISGSTIAEVVSEVRSWRSRELAKYSSRDGCEDLVEAVEDKAACLEAIADSCDSPAEMPEAIRALFDDSANPTTVVTFSSVHRAKGSEARRVYLIDKGYTDRRPVRDWEAQQRRNLKYVSYTRSLHSLTIVPEKG